MCVQTREKKKKAEKRKNEEKGIQEKNPKQQKNRGRKTGKRAKERKKRETQQRGRDSHSAEISTRPTVFVLIHYNPFWTRDTLGACVLCVYECAQEECCWIRTPICTDFSPLKELSSATTPHLGFQNMIKNQNMIIMEKS